MYSVVTTRFNNETLDANYRYRLRHGFKCLYCCPIELSQKILYNMPVFVIEMNNFTNKIEGIGLIKNKPETTRYYKVHQDGNTNRYIYIGNYFLDSKTIQEYNCHLVCILEEILFKGYTHSKRGQGLTLIPEKVLKYDICEGKDIKKEIKDIFMYHFRGKLRTDNATKNNEEIVLL
jgi:hypothetical protein